MQKISTSPSDDRGMRLRRAVADDRERMYVLDQICFDPVFQFDREQIARFATMPGAVTLIVEEGRRLAGFVIVNARRGWGRPAYVTTLDVDPGYRRRGLAGLLMKSAEALAAEAGAGWISLHVWVENAGAIRFYESAGYRRVRLVEDFYAAGVSAWVYRKWLSGDGLALRTAELCG